MINNFLFFIFLFFLDNYNLIYIQIRIPKPGKAQSEYYDGRKKYHCKNYLYLHNGDGLAVYIHGGERGATEDITLLRRSSFYRNRDQYVDHGDYVLCDGAWKNEGSPFLCRFTDRRNLTALELAFNYVLSEKRVICENYYGRMHTLFPILDLFKQRLNKLDVWVRALSYLTNIHIDLQSPLR